MSTELHDENIACSDCKRSFTWTVRDQYIFKTRGTLRPEHCSTCTQARKSVRIAEGKGFKFNSRH